MVYALILFAALSRLLPHPPNATPVAAMALFGAATLPDRRLALAAPLMALLLSDTILGFYGWSGMLAVYGATLLCGLLGRLLVGRERRSGGRIAAAAVGGSVLFFVVTNGACWWTGYPHTAAGLTDCFVLALPFFRNEALATLAGSAILFGGHALLLRAAARRRLTAPV